MIETRARVETCVAALGNESTRKKRGNRWRRGVQIPGAPTLYFGESTMKAITLWQPWASLVAIGAKQIETRSWATPYRGTLAIHAALKFPDEAKALVATQPFLSSLEKITPNSEGFRDLPRGVIVAVCELVQCLSIPTMRGRYPFNHPKLDTIALLPPDSPEYDFGDYTPGRFAWMLAQVRVLHEPIPCRGYQQLWDVPADVLAQIEAQL